MSQDGELHAGHVCCYGDESEFCNFCKKSLTLDILGDVLVLHVLVQIYLSAYG